MLGQGTRTIDEPKNPSAASSLKVPAGTKVAFVGPTGAGHAMKALNNYVSAAGLVAAADGHIIWSGDSYERAAADIFDRFLRPNHMFHRGDELGSKPAMGHQH